MVRNWGVWYPFTNHVSILAGLNSKRVLAVLVNLPIKSVWWCAGDWSVILIWRRRILSEVNRIDLMNWPNLSLRLTVKISSSTNWIAITTARTICFIWSNTAPLMLSWPLPWCSSYKSSLSQDNWQIWPAIYGKVPLDAYRVGYLYMLFLVLGLERWLGLVLNETSFSYCMNSIAKNTFARTSPSL